MLRKPSSMLMRVYSILTTLGTSMLWVEGQICAAVRARSKHAKGKAHIFELFGGEDVGGDQVDLGVTVLARLGGRHVDDLSGAASACVRPMVQRGNYLAGAALDDDVSALAQGRALHGEGEGGARIGRLAVAASLEFCENSCHLQAHNVCS
jgi:hypothetical protein